MSIAHVYLQPGELWFGSNARVRTLLGSCVAVTLWHPLRRVGGICHFMLPGKAPGPVGSVDGRYAADALLGLRQRIDRLGDTPREYEAKLFGGGHMFLDPCGELYEDSVAERNVAAAHMLVEMHGFPVAAMHLGGDGHREVAFDLNNGGVWMRHTPLQALPVLPLATRRARA